MTCHYSNGQRAPGEFYQPIYPPQRWTPSIGYPYPSTIGYTPYVNNQLLVNYAGAPYTQTLSPNVGPVMYPASRCHEPLSGNYINPTVAYPISVQEPDMIRAYPNRNYVHSRYPVSNTMLAYPTTYSIPGPYLYSYISSPRRVYPY